MSANLRMEIPQNISYENFEGYEVLKKEEDDIDAKYRAFGTKKTKNSPTVKKNNAKTEKVVFNHKDFLASLKTESMESKSLEKTKIVRLAPASNKIDPTVKKPQYIRVSDVANHILFSQATISDFSVNKSDNVEMNLHDLATSLFEKFDVSGALDIVYHGKDSKGEDIYTSVDNRRLFTSRKIAAVDSTFGIYVKVHHAADNCLCAKRFPKVENGVTVYPKTWGEAIKFRMGKETGTQKLPTVLSDGKPAKDQNIKLTIDKANYDYSALVEEEFKALKIVGNKVVI